MTIPSKITKCNMKDGIQKEYTFTKEEQMEIFQAVSNGTKQREIVQEILSRHSEEDWVEV